MTSFQKALLPMLLLLGFAACEGDVDTAGAPPVPCGEANCAPSEYCCDAACGLCQESGVACTEKCE